jgi:hypothetical protein
MLSFGELKNLLKRFNDCSRSMAILSKLDYPSSVLDERQIKEERVQFYLQVIHYVLIKYSDDLYMHILAIFPNIKAMTDLDFVKSSITIARKELGLKPLITAENILTEGKWVEKKLEFLVELCEGAMKWKSDLTKKIGKEGKSKSNGGGELKNFMKEPEPMSKYLPQPSTYPQKEALSSNEESDDEDILVQREITVKPTEFPIGSSGTYGRGNEQSRVNGTSFSSHLVSK